MRGMGKKWEKGDFGGILRVVPGQKG